MGVYNAAGSRLTKSAALATFTQDTSNVPLVAGQDLYDSVFTGQEDTTAGGAVQRLLVKAGQVISTSEFNRLFVLPTVETQSPSSSATVGVAGGTVVTLTGTNLDGVTGVTVGGTAATAVTISQAGKKLQFTTPAKTAGTYNVVIADDAGNVTLTNALTFA